MCIPLAVGGGGLITAGVATLAGTQAPSLGPLGEAIGNLRGKGREWVAQGLAELNDQASTPGWKARALAWGLGLFGNTHDGVRERAPGAGSGPEVVRQHQQAEQTLKDRQKDDDGPEQEPEQQ